MVRQNVQPYEQAGGWPRNAWLGNYCSPSPTTQTVTATTVHWPVPWG